MPGSILIVEDHTVTRRNMVGFLIRSGYQVHQAPTGEEAVQLIKNTDNFDVVITDLRMPGTVNGIDVLTYQNQVSPGTGAILVTAFGSDHVREQARALGAVMMDKPINLHTLLQEIQSFIDANTGG